jgi:CheY-like chemotaxis protein
VPASAPPRLVIIDDDPALASVVAEIARDAFPDPHELVIESLTTAEAAVLAIRRMESAPAASGLVLISDFHLPPASVHGVDILAEARRRLPRAKRVLMTGRDPHELQHLLDAAQLDAFVAKPFTFQEMRALIVRLVRDVAAATEGLRVPEAP